MILKICVLVAICALSTAKDDKKWVWGDNNRDGTSRGASARYEVVEDDERSFRPSFQNNYPSEYNERPGYGGSRPDYYPNQRPSFGNRPTGPDFEHPQNQRPSGLYGGGGNYGQGHLNRPQSYPSDNSGPGILTGPIPSWVKEGPYKNFDKCKCTEKFNCNSPGISYGHCDAGKQYCCYATKKIDQIGEPLPSRPVHSIDNGVLVGPGGPVDGPRPGGHRPVGHYPGGSGFGIGGGGGGRPDYGPIGNRPVHSIENGILVGPGGPFDRPVGGRPGGYGNYGGYGRNAKN